MEISLGISPCPNDTFMFDALINQKIDTKGIVFKPIFQDVEELNRLAEQSRLVVSKLSFHAIMFHLDKYQILNSGSALGSGVGPLLIAKKQLNEYELSEARVAIPGKNTTANLLLQLAFPNLGSKHEYLFSDIEAAVINGEVDAGLIIHENRFTYSDKGLVCIKDLGQYWEEVSGNLIPLGGIVVQRDLPIELKLKISDLIKESIQYAYDNHTEESDFVKYHAQEMDVKVLKQHINLYVNQYSLDLQEEGKNAILGLLNRAKQMQIMQEISQPIFVR